MSKKADAKDPIAEFKAGFLKIADGWAAVGHHQFAAQGRQGLGAVWDAMKETLRSLVRRLAEALNWAIEQLGVEGGAQTIFNFVTTGILDVVESVQRLIDQILNTAGVAAETAIEAVLALIEVIKKAIHLTLDAAKSPALTKPVENLLDLIDNLIVSMASILSPEAGKTAKRICNDMYGQLYAIRRADAARSVKPRPRPREDTFEEE